MRTHGAQINACHGLLGIIDYSDFANFAAESIAIESDEKTPGCIRAGGCSFDTSDTVARVRAAGSDFHVLGIVAVER